MASQRASAVTGARVIVTREHGSKAKCMVLVLVNGSIETNKLLVNISASTRRA